LHTMNEERRNGGIARHMSSGPAKEKAERRSAGSRSTPAFRSIALALGMILVIAWSNPVAADKEIRNASPPIRSGAEIAYPPFSIVGENGEASGFSVELMRAALAAMGREVTFRTGPWAEVRGWLERGEIDALPLMGRTPERETLFDFTVPYMSLHGAIVVRVDETGIRDLSDLRGRQVAVMKGDNAEEFLRREERGFGIHTVPTFEIALRELAEGRHDAVVVQRLVGLRLIQKLGLTDLKVIDQPIEGFKQDFCFAVREGDRDTLAVLNEGLSIVVADGTYRHLHAKWFAALQLPTDRAIVVGGDRNRPPFEFMDDRGRPAGFNVELTRAIALEMGLNLEIRLGRWSERMAALKTGKIDVMQGMFYSAGRDLDFDFAPPHAVSHLVAAVRKGEWPAPESLPSFKGRRIVVEGGDILHELAIENGMADQITTVEDAEEALRHLAEGGYDCALVSRVTALHLMEKHGWSNLVLGKKPLISPAYGYAAATGQQALLAQFSEGLKALENSGEYRRIRDKWLGVYQEEPTSLLTALRYSALVIIPLLVILLAAFAWSWALRRQVAEKTRALHESLDRFRYVFEAANVGKSLTLPTGEVHANQAFADFLGYTLDELRGKRWQELTPPEDIETTERLIATLLAGQKHAARFEKRYVHHNGELRWADVSVALRRDADGTPLYFMITAVDINARKQAEAALRESESRFRSMVENAPEPIFIQSQMRFAYLNPKAIKLFGARNAQELLGTPVMERFHPDFHEQVKQRIKTLNEDRRPVNDLLEQKFLRMDGSSVWVETSGQPIVYEGRNGALVLVRDITARKEAERDRQILEGQLNQARKMESVGRLAGGVAHDFNNMLSVIIGYAEIALEKAASDDSLQADLKEIIGAANRSADITRQLLAFARRQTIAPRALELNGTVEEMLKMLRRLIGEDIDLSWRPGDGRMPVFMDLSQIDQILANLCVNARDAISGVGKITIETDRVRFGPEYCADHAGFLPGEFIMLAVSDDGCGMDADAKDKIFDPFFTTKALGKGTGLGLSTVFGIVKQNEGFINVYSEPGKGSTFKIYLPLHAGEAAEERRPEQAGLPQGKGETILIVEDEATILKLARRILERSGYTVLTASTPGKALDLAKAHAGDIHLLITDVVMPEMNGRELAKTLQAACPGIKVLFMSGYTANVIAHRGVLDEGVNFIQKPFSNRDLAVKVREVLEG